jgi:hypothetical protein
MLSSRGWRINRVAWRSTTVAEVFSAVDAGTGIAIAADAFDYALAIGRNCSAFTPDQSAFHAGLSCEKAFGMRSQVLIWEFPSMSGGIQLQSAAHHAHQPREIEVSVVEWTSHLTTWNHGTWSEFDKLGLSSVGRSISDGIIKPVAISGGRIDKSVAIFLYIHRFKQQASDSSPLGIFDEHASRAIEAPHLKARPEDSAIGK